MLRVCVLQEQECPNKIYCTCGQSTEDMNMVIMLRCSTKENDEQKDNGGKGIYLAHLGLEEVA